ncbi:hypothetical protein G7Y89_g8261 [Cudoniella acicularis]|uniref:Uncharacterized protein n=1 Tax=Cudoniella acicularis TaxID=354080 RepID=A0A8H4RJQ1_9HELO|nr:hypothetical protein G7Y89_g8261 [Cudoniella acicularis]
MSKNLGFQHLPTLSVITPPNSFGDSSLPSSATSSPPTGLNTLLRNEEVSRIIDIIQDVRSGRPPCQSWLTFSLAHSDFQTLLAEIKVEDSLRSYFEEKIRYGYFAYRNLFILRIPTSTHEYIIARVVSEIEKQLQMIAPAADIKHLGSPRLELVVEDSDEEDSRKDAHIQDGDGHASRESSATARYDTHEPDAAFGDREDKYPGVVLEVAYSQKKKDLRDLAERYILGSDGNIRIVVGLGLDYQQEKAGISIWRPEIVMDHGSEHLECVQKEFRNKDGQATMDIQAGLELFLQDFATTTRNIPIDHLNRIYIPSSRLCDIVTEAITSKTGQSITHTPGHMITLPPGTRKRKRVKTPPEELASEDEQQYVDAEGGDAKRMYIDDGGEYQE